jgi:predicted phage terminase large subunit-like protein
MNEQDRLELKAQCNSDLYFFLKFAFGFPDLKPELHGQFAKYVSNPYKLFKLIVGPRGHLKTSVCTIGFAAWRALKDPNIRILITANTATNAEHMIRTIKGTVEKNEILRWLYQEELPTSNCKWTEKELEFNRSASWPESTIESLGRGGTVTSRHYDILIEDDLLAPEDNQSISADMVKTCIDYHKYATGLRISSTSEQVISANRWLYDDYVAYLMENEKWFLPCMYMGAYDANGDVRWPERFPPEELDRILEQQGPRIFSAQYLNDPAHEDARSFDMSWLRYYKTFPPLNERNETQAVRCVTAIDPAISQKKHGDFTAIVTLGTDTKRNIYCADARRGKWGIDEMIDNVFEVHRTWKSQRVGLESVMFQKALMYPFREAMRRENVRMNLVELRPSSQISKEARIMSLHEYFANGSIWLNKNHRELLAEIRGFPAIVHDDLLDAFSYALQMLVYPTEQESYTYFNPFAMENVMRELKGRANNSGSVFLWPLGGKTAPVNRNTIPQSKEDIWKLLEASKR